MQGDHGDEIRTLSLLTPSPDLHFEVLHITHKGLE